MSCFSFGLQVQLHSGGCGAAVAVVSVSYELVDVIGECGFSTSHADPQQPVLQAVGDHSGAALACR